MYNNVPLAEKCPTTLMLSSDTTEGLEMATQRLAAWMRQACKPGRAAWPLDAVAAALRDRCRPLPLRRAIRVESWQDALTALADRSRQTTAAALPGPPKVFLSFPGQGSLRPGVLSRLVLSTPAWARHLERYAQLGRGLSGFDIMDWLGDPDADADSVLKDNAKTQLAIFCVSASLGRGLFELGLRPAGYIGHSLGEWVGANLAAVLSDKDAVRAVHHRGRLMQASGPGAALIVRSTLDALAPLLAETRGERAGAASGAPSRGGMGPLRGSPSLDVALACVNAPNLCLVSGRPDAVAACAKKLADARIVAHPAPIHVAVHSAVMDAVIVPFLRELTPLAFAAPKTPMLSTVTGEWMSDEQVRDREYWTRQLRRPVRFDKAVATLMQEPSAIVLEVGMGAALTSLVQAQTRGRNNIRTFALFGRDEPPDQGYDPGRVHQTLAELWTSGVLMDPVGYVKPTRPAPDVPG